MGGDDYTSEAASLYSFSNHTATNATLCPEMGGLESQRGATLDPQKVCALVGGGSMVSFAIAINSVALVRDLSLLTLTELSHSRDIPACEFKFVARGIKHVCFLPYGYTQPPPFA